MGLRDSIRRFAAAAPRILVVAVPGHEQLRREVEAEAGRWGCADADSPARADVLITVGAPGHELAAAIDVLWAQVPEPRLRRDIHHAEDISAMFDGVSALATDEAVEESVTPRNEAARSHDLSMASTAPDRDGLTLDSLKVSLGPWLHGWPTGLIVEGNFQGDILTSPTVRWADDAIPSEGLDVVVTLDVLHRILTLTGPAPRARQARESRDRVFRGEAPDPLLLRWCRQSRALRWATRSLGTIDGADIADRIRLWCDAAEGADLPDLVSPSSLAEALDGAEMGAARLTVASVVVGPGMHHAPEDESETPAGHDHGHMQHGGHHG